MARAASKDIVILGSRRKAKLEAITRRASAPQALARRARIVLLVHAGWPNARIAAELGCAEGTVRTWRRRFIRGGIPALADRPRSGRPRSTGRPSGWPWWPPPPPSRRTTARNGRTP